MKRTRRVEIITYSRSTVVSDEAPSEPDPTAEQAAIDLLLQIPNAIESHGARQTAVGQETVPTTSDVSRSRRPLRLLKRLIQE